MIFLLNSLPSHLCTYMGWQLAGKISCCFVWSLVLFSTGSRFCYLGLTALPVEAHRSKQNTSSSIPPERVSSASTMTVLEQRHWWNDTHWWICFWLSNPLSRWKKQQTFKLQHLFSHCTEECPVWQHQLCRALVPELLWFYLYVFPYLIPVRPCCTGVAANDWRLQVLPWTPDQVPPRRTKPVSVSCLWYALLKQRYTQGVPSQWYKYIFFLD